MSCIFCRISTKEVPAKILMETEKSIAFLDAFPLTKGHTLVIPKSHYAKIQEMSISDTSDLFETVRLVTEKVDRITGATLIAIHNGKESGQEIPHVHVHLIPRSSHDTAGPVHSMFRGFPKPSENDISDSFRILTS